MKSLRLKLFTLHGHTHTHTHGVKHYLPDWPHVGKQRCGQSCRRRLRSLWDWPIGERDGEEEVAGESRF